MTAFTSTFQGVFVGVRAEVQVEFGDQVLKTCPKSSKSQTYLAL